MPNMAAWCPNWPAATTSAGSCRSRRRLCRKRACDMPTSTRLPTRKAPAWAARCWLVLPMPTRWPLHWANPSCPCTIWKATCFRRCCRKSSLHSPLSPCSYQVGTHNSWPCAASAITNFWAKRWTTRPAKPSTKPANSSACLIPPARSCPNTPNSVRPTHSPFRAPCCTATICR